MAGETFTADTLVTWRFTHPQVALTWYWVGARYEVGAEAFASWITAHCPGIEAWDGLGADWHEPDVLTDTENAWHPWDEHPRYRTDT